MNERKAPACIGRFNLRRELGRGAQATVWLAHDTRLDREVALKLLDANGSALALDEWLHEAQPGAMLLDEKELALLRTLRNQGVMAFRQAG